MTTRGDDIDLALEERLDRVGSTGVLERVAFTLGSTLDLKEVLRRLSEIVQEAASAQRCSIVLIEGDRLKPAVAISGRPDDDLWSAFRTMPPIEIGDDAWRLLRRGQVVAYEDARESPHIPASWVERFSLRAVAIVPLAAKGEPCGAMAVDWPEVRTIDPEELALLEAIGTYAGLAVHNARLHERVARKSRTLEHLVEVASALNSSPSLSGVLDRICDGFRDLLGAVHTSVNLADPAEPLRARILASKGEDWLARLPGRGDPLPPEELLADGDVWRDSSGPIVYPRLSLALGGQDAAGPTSVRSAALFPLYGQHGLIGSVVAGFPCTGGPESDELDTGQTLAEMAATAIGRADLHEQLERRLRQLEILSGLSEVVAGTVDLAEALGQVNVTLPDLGLHLLSVAIPNASLREVIGGREPDADETRALESWQSSMASAEHPLGLRLAADDLLVPVVHHHQLQGVLRIGRTEDPVAMPDEEFLMAVGAACAEVIHRAGLSRALRESERRLAVAEERERIAQDLHDSAGQLLTGVGLQLAEYVHLAPDGLWRSRLEGVHELTRQGEREIREAVYSLLFVQVREQGLVRSVQDLAERFETTTGIAVDVAVDGEPVPLGTGREDALFRVVHEALTNVERHARASRVEVRLAYGNTTARLLVQDDGVGLGDGTSPSTEDGHFGLHTLSRRVAGVSGTLQVHDADSGGVVLTASVPTL